MAISDWFKFKQKPLATSVSKAASGGLLYSEQAIHKMNSFFDNVMRLETDEVLKSAGIARHELASLLSDDEIAGKIDIIRDNLLQSKYTLSDGDSEVSTFIYEQLDKHIDTLLIAVLNAIMLGYSVPEITWTSTVADKLTRVVNSFEDGSSDTVYLLNGRQVSEKTRLSMCNQGVRYPEFVTEKPMQWFEPKSDGRLLWFTDNGSRGVSVDKSFKYILIQHRPTYAEPKGDPILSKVYWPWYFKKNGWQFWSKFLERFGSPLLIGTTENDPQLLANALMSAHNQSVVAMGAGDAVTSISATSNGEAFKSYDDAINKRITKYLLGQTLTTGADGGGTYGQGLIHQGTQQDKIDGYKKFAAKHIQKFIDNICLLNGYDSPAFNFTFEKGLQPERAERDSKLYSQGVRFNESYYIDAYDFNPEYIKIVEADDAPTLFSERNQRGSKFDLAWHQFKAADDSAGEFTPEQMELEEAADSALDTGLQPFDTKAVLSAISNATDADSLREALFDLCGEGLAESEFTQLLNTALAVVDAHGFADESSEV